MKNKNRHTTRSPQQQPSKQTYNYYALYPIKVEKAAFNL